MGSSFSNFSDSFKSPSNNSSYSSSSSCALVICCVICIYCGPSLLKLTSSIPKPRGGFSSLDSSLSDISSSI